MPIFRSLGLAVAPRVRFLQKKLGGSYPNPKIRINSESEEPDREKWNEGAATMHGIPGKTESTLDFDGLSHLYGI